MKKLFLMAVLLMTSNLVSFGQEKAGGELATDEFYLKLMSPNIQTRQGLDEYLSSPGNSWNNLYSYNNLYQIYLAKHEKEAFQIYYHERGTGHDIRLEIGDYTDPDGNILPHSIYQEEFFSVENVSTELFAEALVPYNGGSIHVDNGQKCVFYVELESAPDQPAGVYTSTFALYEGDELLQSHEITALVWNFALPEAHYGTTFAGLYNSVSGYGTTKGFLEKSGVNFQGGNPASDADRIEAERILEGWQEVLLDHGVSTYEIPRFMIDSDPKKAELALADTRRKAFVVPSYSSEKILQYKDIVYNNPFLADKSLFYYKDEPKWTGEGDQYYADYIQTRQFAEYLESLWPGFHSVIPTYNGNSFVIQKLREMTDIFCPNQGLIAGNQNMYNTFTDGSWHRTWRYLPQNHLGCIAVVRWNKMHMGTMAKAVYWQQEAMNSDGLLNWNIGFVPYVNETPYDVWENHSIFPAIYPANVNGESIFLYESASLGLDPANPIVSLRLKHMSNGMDDYDYLQLAKEAFGTDEDSPYMQAMNTVFRFYTSAGHQYIFSCESSPWDGNHPYEWVAHDDTRFVNARIILGNALSEAMAGQHEYGEWQTAVLPDDTHNGLEIRTCSHCGAQESREKTFLYRFVGTQDSLWTNLANWEGNPETLPASGEAVVIANNCEINTNTTVFNVIVNNGFNLTVNEGATLTSRRMSTGEDAQVILEDGAQLYTYSEGVQATVKKNIAPHGDSDGWYFISTSLATEVEPSTDNGIVSSPEDSYDLYYFDQSKNLEWRNYKANGFNLENGKGYLYASPSEKTLNFEGQLNASNAEISIPISYTNSPLAGLNLVGNPFSCNAYLLDENNEIMPLYKLNDTGDTIVAAQAGTAIKPCEGVLVVCPNDRQTHSVFFTATAPENIGEAQSVPPVLLPLHDLLVNQDASLTNDIIQTATLTQGWNWWSTYVDVTLDELKAALVETLPGTTITIKSKTQNMHYNDTTWRGNLNSMDVTQMYKISVGADCEIMLEGMPVNSADYPVTITNGTNWIEFPLRESMSLTEAFEGFAVSGDMVKSKDNGNAIYNGTTWVGSLDTLVPGEGYIYKSNATESRTLIFPASTR